LVNASTGDAAISKNGQLNATKFRHRLWWVLNIVIRMSRISDKSNNQQQEQEPIGKITQQISKLGPPMMDQIMDKLTGTNTSITYFFENFEIGLPEIQGSKGQQIKSVVVNDN
jgi:hypothetical protein